MSRAQVSSVVRVNTRVAGWFCASLMELGENPLLSATTLVVPGSSLDGAAGPLADAGSLFEQATAKIAADKKSRGRANRSITAIARAAWHRVADVASASLDRAGTCHVFGFGKARLVLALRRLAPQPKPMNLAALFPSFCAERILYEDDDIIAIDKPAGISTHAADSRKRDDAVSRLSNFIGERDGMAAAKVYLGIHQRLDRDTSGVLVFTKRQQANASLAAQFENRRVAKRYLAAVEGWPPRLDEGVMRNTLVREAADRMRVARSPREKGSLAITHFRVFERVGHRALLELRPETGRTHQLRVQISAMGAAIAGDRIYGKAAAERLMLHAASLRLEKPATGRKLSIEANVPDAIPSWVRGKQSAPFESTAAIERTMREAAAHRYWLGHAEDTTAFRLVHEAADGLPGVALDIYGDHLLLHLSSPEAEVAREQLLDAAWALGPRGVYIVARPKHASVIVDPRQETFAPTVAQRGEGVKGPLTVLESGLSYRIKLGDGLKTGLFLDQRENRRRVRELAGGKRVLNLFAYTCAFTVAAAAGGASRTVSVDASAAPLDDGRENLEANGLSGPHHEVVVADAIVWMQRAQKRGERFDLIVLDPPSFATTRTSRFSAESDYRAVATLALRLLAPGGRLLACTNSRKISRLKFRRNLHEAVRDAGHVAVQVKDLPDPSDFPAPFGKESHLKSALVTVARDRIGESRR